MGERRRRGGLEADVKRVCDAFVMGNYKVPGGKPFTPFRICLALVERDSLAKAPSVGAVSSVLQRWELIGAATMDAKPYAFVDWTDAGREVGLRALNKKHREDKRTMRAAIRAAEKIGEMA